MRNSAFTTLLMFLPLVAIPLLAIFGIPEFRPVSASAPTEPSPQLIPAGENPWQQESSVAQPFPGPAQRKQLPPSSHSPVGYREKNGPGTALPRRKDPFRSAQSVQAETQSSSPADTKWEGWQIDTARLPGNQQVNRAAIREPQRPLLPQQSLVSMTEKNPTAAPLNNTPAAPFGNRGAAERGNRSNSLGSVENHPAHQFDQLVEQKLREREKKESASLSFSARHVSSNGSSPSATQITWQQAVDRLNQLGITNFVLQPGSRPQHFLFSCLYSPPGNAQVVHRFEGEHTDPLQAVLDVLRQIEEHLQKRK